MKKTILLVCLAATVVSVVFLIWTWSIQEVSILEPIPKIQESSVTPSPTTAPKPIPNSHIIPQRTHVFQTFNNCGPSGLTMQLSYFNIDISQQVIGQSLRPYQNPSGDNDDKSVTLEELEKESAKYNLIAFHRPGGSIEVIKRLIAADLPVLVRTWTTTSEDIGHYRLVRGYDNQTKEIIQDDSLQGNNLRFSYEDFLTMWRPFNYEYLVLVPRERENIVSSILGENVDAEIAWINAEKILEDQLSQDPDNIYALFNMSIAEFHLGDYQSSVDYFEMVEGRLPFRTLWYQIEPIKAYQKVGDYQRVFEITDRILNGGNRAFSELYIIRGEIHQAQGNVEAAKQEFQRAVLYNENSEDARTVLNRLEQ